MHGRVNEWINGWLEEFISGRVKVWRVSGLQDHRHHLIEGTVIIEKSTQDLISRGCKCAVAN
jgi:hypothetical protein